MQNSRPAVVIGNRTRRPRGSMDRAPVKVAVIGLGKAGGRFLQALRYMRAADPSITVSTICDIDESLLDSVDTGGDVQRFTDYRVALSRSDADIICVCVNEYMHYDILKHIKRSGVSFKRVLCEKPLTETIEQCDEIAREYSEREICLNFVERYSPIVADFARWLRDNPMLRMARAEFFWGKFRVNDTRPTIGDDSEITHPLDLVRHLAKLPSDCEARILSCSLGYSDFSSHADEILDSIDAQLELGDSLLVTGHSSFVWEERRRRIVFYMRDEQRGDQYQAVLNFDDPYWDNDSLVVYSIAPVGGARSVVFRSQYTAEDFPKEIFKVAKIHRFLCENIATLNERRIGENLATLSDGTWVQTVIHELREKGAPNGDFRCRLGAERLSPPWPEEHGSGRLVKRVAFGAHAARADGTDR